MLRDTLRTPGPIRPERQLELAHTRPPQGATGAAPIVKWAGGKGRLLPQLLPLLPRRVGGMRHIEPFMGGGALFFACRPTHAILGDINTALVATHAMVRDRLDAVIGALRPLARAHNEPEAYYRVRDHYNTSRRRPVGPTQAARFLYLNRVGFNGLYRVNRRGEFNVPRGRYRNPRIVRTPELRAASARLRDVELVAGPFEATLERARPGDFVYLDPPYHPLSATANFTAYAAGGFVEQDQRRLRVAFDELTQCGCFVMASSSDSPFIRELYDGYQIDEVLAPRSVNRDASRRGLVRELVIRNYT